MFFLKVVVYGAIVLLSCIIISLLFISFLTNREDKNKSSKNKSKKTIYLDENSKFKVGDRVVVCRHCECVNEEGYFYCHNCISPLLLR